MVCNKGSGGGRAREMAKASPEERDAKEQEESAEPELPVCMAIVIRGSSECFLRFQCRRVAM